MEHNVVFENVGKEPLWRHTMRWNTPSRWIPAFVVLKIIKCYKRIIFEKLLDTSEVGKPFGRTYSLAKTIHKTINFTLHEHKVIFNS